MQKTPLIPKIGIKGVFLHLLKVSKNHYEDAIILWDKYHDDGRYYDDYQVLVETNKHYPY